MLSSIFFVILIPNRLFNFVVFWHPSYQYNIFSICRKITFTKCKKTSKSLQIYEFRSAAWPEGCNSINIWRMTYYKGRWKSAHHCVLPFMVQFKSLLCMSRLFERIRFHMNLFNVVPRLCLRFTIFAI
jgi:hypothetical protein